MLKFLKSVLAAAFGFIVGLVLLFFFFAGIGALLSDDDTPSVRQGSVLKIDLDVAIRERSEPNPFKGIDEFDVSVGMGLHDIARAIRYAATDDRIEGISMETSFLPTGWANAEVIRRAMSDFRDSGKWILSYTNFLTNRAYYLASEADAIFINPSGVVDFSGFGVELTYFKNALDKLEIKPEIFTAGKFKSAVEPFRQDSMGDANREQIREFLEVYKDQAYKQVARARGLSVSRLEEIADNLLVRNAQTSVEHGLIDGQVYLDQFQAIIRDSLGLEENKRVPYIDLDDYSSTLKLKRGDTDNRIAILYAEGDMVMGKGESGEVGAKTFMKALQRIRKDDRIKAVVLRVNSPGGVSITADMMWRELSLLNDSLPVVVSMGNYAASGGYYIACASDSILAEPFTITGSIGVFGMMFSTEDFFANKLGVTFDREKIGRFADMGLGTRPFTEEERAIIQSEVDRIYEEFLSRVTDGRGMSRDMADSLGQGRVWTGIQALENGLVDRLGGLQDAIDVAVRMAQLEDYRLVEYPKQKGPFAAFLDGLPITSMQQQTEVAIQNELGVAYPVYKQWRELYKLQGYQARLPIQIDVR